MFFLLYYTAKSDSVCPLVKWFQVSLSQLKIDQRIIKVLSFREAILTYLELINYPIISDKHQR